MTTTTSYANDITVETRLVAITCADCCLPFGIGAAFQQKRREDHRTFYCPNGHSNYYPVPAESREKKLERQLRSAQARATHYQDQAQAAERSARAYKGVATRVKKRAAHGVCPAPGCKRSFADVARHMAGQHPEFVAEHAAWTHLPNGDSQ